MKLALKDVIDPGIEDADVIAAVDASLEAGMDRIEHRYDLARLVTASFGHGDTGCFAATLLSGSLSDPRRVLTVWWKPTGVHVVRH